MMNQAVYCGNKGTCGAENRQGTDHVQALNRDETVEKLKQGISFGIHREGVICEGT